MSRGCLIAVGLVFRRAVVIGIVAVRVLGRLVGDLSPVAVLVSLVSDDLFASVRQVDGVLSASLLVLVGLTAGLLVAIVIVDVELESVVVPSLFLNHSFFKVTIMSASEIFDSLTLSSPS